MSLCRIYLSDRQTEGPTEVPHTHREVPHMKKNSIATKIAAAAIACTIIATPALAIAQPTAAKAATPAVVTYQFRMDDLPFGYQFHDERVIPAAYAKAVDVALKHAGFTYKDVEIDDVYVFTAPAYDEPVVEVEFEAGLMDYDYVVGLNTLHIYQFVIDD